MFCFLYSDNPFSGFAEILQSLLNLAEFMEHDVEALPISLSILAELAQKGHAYAKALHYRYDVICVCGFVCFCVVLLYFSQLPQRCSSLERVFFVSLFSLTSKIHNTISQRARVPNQPRRLLRVPDQHQQETGPVRRRLGIVKSGRADPEKVPGTEGGLRCAGELAGEAGSLGRGAGQVQPKVSGHAV